MEMKRQVGELPEPRQAVLSLVHRSGQPDASTRSPF
jgi:hypothetical protein